MHNTCRTAKVFLLALAFVASGFCAYTECPPLRPAESCRIVSGGKVVQICSDRISLLDHNGKRTSSWDPTPFRVMDACPDPARPLIYLVLQRPGAERGERMAAVSTVNEALKLVFLDRDRGFNPWKVLAGDVDGDGTSEIIYLVFKKSRFQATFANRIFVFGWDGRQLYPKWLGSRLSSPFLDVSLVPLEKGGSMLLALESEAGGGRRIMSYRWCGFGFQGDQVVQRGGPLLTLCGFHREGEPK